MSDETLNDHLTPSTIHHLVYLLQTPLNLSGGSQTSFIRSHIPYKRNHQRFLHVPADLQNSYRCMLTVPLRPNNLISFSLEKYPLSVNVPKYTYCT